MYAMAVERYELFCTEHALNPWPTDGIQVVVWLLDLVDTVKPASMQMYFLLQLIIYLIILIMQLLFIC
jgi:hypothetical protein